MKKKVKTIILLVILAVAGIEGWNAYQDYQLFRNGDGTEYKGEFVEDTGFYSSYGGNTANGSNLYVNADGEILVHYSSAVGRGGTWPADAIGNLTTGELYVSGGQEMDDAMFGILYDDMCFYGSDFYGLRFTGGKDDENYSIVRGNLTDGTISTLVDDTVSNFMIANDVTYYQRGESLYRINPETSEEELVAEGANGNYFFHNDTLYFIKEYRLYAMSLIDKTTTQVSEHTCTWAFMHEGRIFYNGEGYGFSWLMSMNPDGTNNKAHMILETNKVGMCDGKLYYVKNTSESGEEIFCIDLNDEEMTETEIAVKESAANCIYQFYGENIEKRLRQFPESDAGSEFIPSDEIAGFEVCDGYIVFYLEGTVNSWMMNEAFLYNIETKEVSLVNEMLGLDIIYDYYLR